MGLTTRRRAILVLVVVAIAAGTSIGLLLGSDAPTSAAKARLPGVLQCTGKVQSRPSSYVLTCADANSNLVKLKWRSWGATRASAVGSYSFNNCVPYCAAGKVLSYPATVVFSSPRTTKAGRLFTKATITYRSPTGNKVLVDSLLTTPLATLTASGSEPSGTDAA